MPPLSIENAQNEECRVHSAPARSANRMLLLMVAASLGLIIWHVAVYGPSGATSGPEAVQRPFLTLLGIEGRDLLIGPHGMAAELQDVLPYFLIGILLAGAIRTYKIAVKLQAKLKRYGVLSVFLASFVGILTPLCACGTLTTAISLLFAGLPLAPVMALLVTSPLMSPSTYLITLNDLGPEWTVIRTIAAFAMGIFAGLVTHFLKDRGFRTQTLFIEGAIPRGDLHDEDYPDERLRCNCKEKFGNRVAARTQNKFAILLAKSSEMLWTVGKYVLVGVAIGTIVERYMPYEWIYQLFGRRDPLNILWVTLGSVPIFLHQISASSILHHIKSSLHGTMDNGAALAFMIGGPVTAVPTMVLFWTIFKKRVFFLYLFVCLVGTVLIAYAFQFLVFVPHVDMDNPLLRSVRSLSGGASAAIEKKSRNVRIVMDPGGKSLIATYTNDVEGHGGVVFDAGPARFLGASAEKYDNGRYVQNIAEWLEQTNGVAPGKRILIFAPGMGDAIPEGLIAGLEQKGFAVTRVGREVPAVTDRLLEGYTQLWMFTGGPGASPPVADDQPSTISRFTAAGKGLLIVANGGDLSAANRIAAPYGVVFSGSAINQDELPATTGSSLLQGMSRVLGSILKLVHKA